MSKFKVLRKVGVQLQGDNDGPGPIQVDLLIDDKHAMSAQGFDDSIAFQNLLTKMEREGYSAGDLAAVRLSFNVSLGEKGDTSEND